MESVFSVYVTVYLPVDSMVFLSSWPYHRPKSWDPPPPTIKIRIGLTWPSAWPAVMSSNANPANSFIVFFMFKSICLLFALFNHAHNAVHPPPMPRECTQVRVISRFGRRSKFQRKTFPRIHQGCMMQHFRDRWDILLLVSL